MMKIFIKVYYRYVILRFFFSKNKVYILDDKTNIITDCLENNFHFEKYLKEKNRRNFKLLNNNI